MVVILITILMIGAGWTAFRRLPIDAFPDVTEKVSWH
jgi:Cu/Ag efflux pump CusA